MIETHQRFLGMFLFLILWFSLFTSIQSGLVLAQPIEVFLIEPHDGDTVSPNENGVVTIRAEYIGSECPYYMDFYIDGVRKGHIHSYSPCTTSAFYNWSTLEYNDGWYYIDACVTYQSGTVIAESEVIEVYLDNPDNPQIRIIDPLNNETVNGAVDITARVTVDPTWVYDTKVKFTVDGNLIDWVFNPTGQENYYTFYYTLYNWDTTSIPDGPHTISAKVYDEFSRTEEDNIIVMVQQSSDNPPSVEITYPHHGDTESGKVRIKVTASDDHGIQKVEVRIDGGSPVVTFTTVPNEYEWDTTTVNDGWHTIEAKAYDTANQTDTHSISVYVEQKYWTFMVYIDGDDTGFFSLEGAAIDDLNEMEFIGSSANVNIVVQIDRISGWDTSNGDWTTTRIYYVTQDPNGYDGNNYSLAGTIVSTLITDLGEMNMGDPQTLIDFVNWAMATYPAQNYALVLWDHGSGWKFPTTPIKGVCFDDTSEGDGLTQPELRRALSQITGGGANKLEVIGFDACLMGMLEIDYDIMPYADYRVGSEEIEPGDGWDYQSILTALVGTPGMTPAQLAAQIVNDYMNFYGFGGYETQSAINLGRIQTLATAVDTLSTDLLNNVNKYCTEIKDSRANSEEYSDSDYVDLYHFAQLINSAVSNPAIQTSAQNVMNAVTGAVIAEGHGALHANSHGISIYYSRTSGAYLTRYETDVLLSADTNWDEFIKSSYTCIPPSSSLLAARSAPTNRTDFNRQMHPLAQIRINQAEELIQDVQNLIEEAETDGKDMSASRRLLAQAQEALEKAYTYFAEGNYIAANYWALRALAISQQIIEDIQQLLS